MPESNWVALELAARGIPVLVGRLRQVPRRCALPRCRPTTCAPRGSTRDAHAEELFGVDADALLLGGASAGGNLTAGAVARAAGCRLSRCPPGWCASIPAVHPNGPRHPARSDPASPHGAARAELRRLGRGPARPARFAALGRVRRVPADARRRLRDTMGCAPRERRSRVSSRMPASRCALHLEPGAGPRSHQRAVRPHGAADDRGDRRVDQRMNQETADLVRAGLRGAVDVEVSPTGLTPVRLPLSARAQSDSDWMWIAAEQASGVRCEFRTAATWIELDGRDHRPVSALGSGPRAVVGVLCDGRRRAGRRCPRDRWIRTAPGRARRTAIREGRAGRRAVRARRSRS